MRFIDLQNEVADLVGFTDGAVSNSGFSTDIIKRAINRRYEAETLLAQQHGRRSWFHKVQSFTWSSGEETLTVPASISSAAIIRLEDITNNDPGSSLPPEVFWKDNKTLQWGSTSPGSDITIRATYFARPVEMVNDADEPELIPPEMRMLLVWSAAVFLRQKADEGAPGQWLEMLNEERMTFWKWLSKARPQSDTASGAFYDITIDGAQVTQDGASISQDNN
jgi:hypothetical protein